MTRASSELISWGAKRLLFPHWKLKPGEVDLTVMQVIVEVEKDEQGVAYVYDMLDRYDRVTDTHSMGRDEACVDFMLNGLDQRGVVYNLRIEEL